MHSGVNDLASRCLTPEGEFNNGPATGTTGTFECAALGKITFLHGCFNYSFERGGCQFHPHSGNCLVTSPRSLPLSTYCQGGSLSQPRGRSQAGAAPYPMEWSVQFSERRRGQQAIPWGSRSPTFAFVRTPHWLKCHGVSTARVPGNQAPTSVMVTDISELFVPLTF